MATDGSLIFDTAIDNSGFNNGISTLQLAAGNAIGNIAASMIQQISDVIAQVPAQMVSVGSSFEASMSQVAATMGITSAAAEFDILSDAAKEMGEATKFSASQAGEALNYLALAGYDAEKAVNALPTVLNVAAAGGMELAAASDMVTDAMSALGLETSQMSDFSDKLAVTAQKSNTSVAQLGEAILTVGGTAKSLAGGVVEMNTVLGIFADNGIKGAEGGTALRNVILSLSAPTSTAAAALERLKVSAFDVNGNMRPLEDTFADINTALSQLTEQDKNAVLSDIFNKVDLKSVNALLGTSAARFDELSGYIDNCSGAAADMAKTMDDNLKGDLTIMQSALEGLGIAAYEKFQTPMRNAVQSVTEQISNLTQTVKSGKISDSFKKIAAGIGNIASKIIELTAEKVLPALIDGFTWIIDNGNLMISLISAAASVVIAYKVATTAATAAQTAMNIAADANPYVLIASAVLAVGTAIYTYIKSVNSAISSEKELAKQSSEIIAKSQAEANSAEYKADRYKYLYEQYQKTGEASLEMKLLAEDLQELAPDTIDLIDEETGAYKELDDSINDVIESMRRKGIEEAKQNTLQGHYDNMTHYMTEQINAEKNFIDQVNALNISADTAAEFEKGINGKYAAFFDGTANGTEIIDGLNYNEILGKIDGYTGAMERRNEKVAELQGKIEEEQQAIAGVDEAFANLYGDTFSDTAAVEEIKSSAQMAAEEYADKCTELAKQMADETTAAQNDAAESIMTEWQAAEHEYAIGVITSEQELYNRKKEIWDKYGDESNSDHWKYYEDLYDMQQDFADKSKDAYDKQLQDEWNAIEHSNALGLESDEQTLQRKLDFIQKYCPEYSEKWYDYYKDVYDMQQAEEQKQLDSLKDSMSDQIDTVKDGLNSILKAYKEAYKDIKDNIDSYKKKLLSVGDAFEVIENKDGSKTLKVNNLKEQMAEMRKYNDYIKKLRDEGASASLISELTSMDFADGSAFAKNLASLSDKDFAEINNYYQQRDELAQSLAEDMYQPDITNLNNTLEADITAQFEQLPEAIRAAGIDAVNAFIMGLGDGDLYEQVNTFCDNFIEACNDSIKNADTSIDIDSLTDTDTYAIGQQLGNDFVAGFNAAAADIQATVQSEQAQITASYMAGSKSSDTAQSVSEDRTECIIIENHISAQLDVDGEKMAEKVIEKTETINRRKGK